MENHSFDDHLGMLGRGDGLTLGADGRPVNYNPDPAAATSGPSTIPNTCGYADSSITQSWDASHICWDHGTNMGFVRPAARPSMGYWTGERPALLLLAGRAVPDRRPLLLLGHGADLPQPALPHRRHRARRRRAPTRSGISHTDAPNGTIFDRLDQLRHHLEGLLPRPADRGPLPAHLPRQPHHRHGWRPSTSSSPTPPPASSRRSRSSTPTPTTRRRTATSRSARPTPPAIINAVLDVAQLGQDGADPRLRRARRLVRPRAAGTGGPAGQRPARDHRAARPAGRYDYTGFRVPCVRGLALGQAGLRLPRRLRPHLDPQVRRDEVEPAGDDLPGRQRPRHARLLRLLGATRPRSPSRRPCRRRSTRSSARCPSVPTHPASIPSPRASRPRPFRRPATGSTNPPGAARACLRHTNSASRRATERRSPAGGPPDGRRCPPSSHWAVVAPYRPSGERECTIRVQRVRRGQQALRGARAADPVGSDLVADHGAGA